MIFENYDFCICYGAKRVKKLPKFGPILISQEPRYGIFPNFAAKLGIKRGPKWHVSHFPKDPHFGEMGNMVSFWAKITIFDISRST